MAVSFNAPSGRGLEFVAEIERKETRRALDEIAEAIPAGNVVLVQHILDRQPEIETAALVAYKGVHALIGRQFESVGVVPLAFADMDKAEAGPPSREVSRELVLPEQGDLVLWHAVRPVALVSARDELGIQIAVTTEQADLAANVTHRLELEAARALIAGQNSETRIRRVALGDIALFDLEDTGGRGQASAQSFALQADLNLLACAERHGAGAAG